MIDIQAGTTYDQKTVARRVCRAYADPTHSGLARITCDCGKTLVRQPYMTSTQWSQLVAEFEAAHGAVAAS